MNHLSHFLLTALLHDQLAAAPAARVVNVSSTGHTFARNGLDFDDLDWERRKYRGFLVYCATKLANVLFTRELARRDDDTKITANAVHPGLRRLQLRTRRRHGPLHRRRACSSRRPFAISSAHGARTSVYLASSPDVDGISGQYFYKCQVAKPSDAALDDAAAARLWDVSVEACRIAR